MKDIMDLVSELQEKIKWINSYNAAYGITTQEYIINNFDLEDPGVIPLPKTDLIVPDDAYDNIKENLLKELKEYNPELLSKDRVLAITKCDLADDELRAKVRKHLPKTIPSVMISSVTGEGLSELKDLPEVQF